MEFLVSEQDTEDERHHTQLVLAYLKDLKIEAMLLENRIQQLGSADSSAKDAARTKLKGLLQTSSRYRVRDVLTQVQGTDLHAECAILYGKLGQHDDALKLLVYNLQDHAGAEQYCHDYTGGDRTARQQLYESLLHVYMSPVPASQRAKMGGGPVDLTPHAIELLNSPRADLNATEVLSRLPHEWSIGVVERFLRRSVRLNVHEERMRRIEHGLARQAWLQASAELQRLKLRGTLVTDDSRCSLSGKRLGENPIHVDAVTGAVWLKKYNHLREQSEQPTAPADDRRR